MRQTKKLDGDNFASLKFKSGKSFFKNSPQESRIMYIFFFTRNLFHHDAINFDIHDHECIFNTLSKFSIKIENKLK